MTDDSRLPRGEAPEATGRGLVAATEDEGWARLPGLFSWSEVCSLFDAGSGHDREWRFSVRRVSTDEKVGPLYVVRAALRQDLDPTESARRAIRSEK